MSTDTRTPLQAVVSVICDCLADLPASDQARALEAARVTLGLRPPRASHDLNPYQEISLRPALPLVEVQMMNNHPVVQNPAADLPGQRLVVAGPQRTAVLRQRQLPVPAVQAGTAQAAPRGYVRPVR